MKVQITCSRCGFVAFVSPKTASLELVGWRLDGQPPTRVAVCPACGNDQRPTPWKAKTV